MIELAEVIEVGRSSSSGDRSGIEVGAGVEVGVEVAIEVEAVEVEVERIRADTKLDTGGN